MSSKFLGVFWLLAGTGMSLLGIWANTIGLVVLYPDLGGEFMVLPAGMAVLAAIVCPVTAAAFGLTVTFHMLGWPLWQAAAVFGWWMALVTHWRIIRPYIASRLNLIRFLKDAWCMARGLPLDQDEVPTEIPSTGPIPMRVLLPKIYERFFGPRGK